MEDWRNILAAAPISLHSRCRHNASALAGFGTALFSARRNVALIASVVMQIVSVLVERCGWHDTRLEPQKGMIALRQLVALSLSGQRLGQPDGPRAPYKLTGRDLPWLKTCAAIVPLHREYASCGRLKLGPFLRSPPSARADLWARR